MRKITQVRAAGAFSLLFVTFFFLALFVVAGRASSQTKEIAPPTKTMPPSGVTQMERQKQQDGNLVHPKEAEAIAETMEKIAAILSAPARRAALCEDINYSGTWWHEKQTAQRAIYVNWGIHIYHLKNPCEVKWRWVMADNAFEASLGELVRKFFEKKPEEEAVVLMIDYVGIDTVRHGRQMFRFTYTSKDNIKE